jgi:hypothetical protein
MQIALSEVQTKYHQEKVKTAVVNIPGRGRIELALSDTARCARAVDAARRTLINLAGGEDEFESEKELETNAQLLHVHCRRLQNLKVDGDNKKPAADDE